MASSSDVDGVSRPTNNNAFIALLRRLRAGDHVHFVHHVDVCAAPPEVLVADLEPVPGTGLQDDGHGRIWYLYHAKKFTNTQGKLSGYRQRTVTGGGGACWHQEARKPVEGSGGGTYCTLSYGIKKDPSARSIVRLGWCMTEYDFVAADEQQDEDDAAATSNYVLCKVYRSPRAKGKPAPASASASSSGKNKKASSSKKTGKKRKAGGGEHPEAPPAKSIHQQQQELQVQQETAFCYQYQAQDVESENVGDFNFNIEDIHFYVDENMLANSIQQQQEPPQVQQETAYCYQQQDVQEPQVQAAGPGMESSEHGHGGVNFNIQDFNVDEYKDILDMLRDEPELEPAPGQQQQPTIVVEPEHDGGFMQLPCGPVLPAGDTTTYGACRSYSPSWLYSTGGIGTAAGCSSTLLQLQGSSLHLPSLMC